MGKVFVKLKDKTSVRWLPSQKVTIVGSIPQQVDETAEVSKLIKAGVLVKTDAKEYTRVHNKAKASQGEKLKLSIDLFKNAITEKNVKEAEKQLKLAHSAGMTDDEVKKASAQIVSVKESIESENEQKERTAKAELLAQEAIEKDVFETDKQGFFKLGRKRIGKEADQIISWASKNDKNLKELEDAITAKASK